MMLVLIIIRIWIVFVCDLLETADAPPVNSPSGNYEFRIHEEDTYVQVGVYDTTGNLLFLDDEKYYKRFRLIVEWQEDDDVLWIYSGDIGTYCIFAENNEWQELPANAAQIVGKPPRRIARQLASLRLILTNNEKEHN